MSMLKETFCIPLGISKVACRIISYVLKIDTYIDWLAEISTKNSRGIIIIGATLATAGCFNKYVLL